MKRNKDKQPPSNKETEGKLLGSILIDPKIIGKLSLSQNDFFDPAHAEIYRSMQSLHKAGKLPEVTVLTGELKRRKVEGRIAFDYIGGVSGLARIAGSAANASHYKTYVKEITDCAVKRNLRFLGEHLFDAAHNGQPVSEVLAEANRRLEKIKSSAEYAEPSQAVIVNMADVTPEAVRWLWPGRIALGKPTLIAGDPGLGKSFLTLDLAARVSIGAAWPDDAGTHAPKGGVVLLSAEDDVADTIRPRLDAAGADVGRIVALQAMRRIDPDSGAKVIQSFSLERDLPALEQAIKSTSDCRLVVIDPITAYLGKVDSNKNAELRGLLAPLAELAARNKVAVVAVTHLNKSGGGQAMYRAMGSLAFVAAVRAAWLVVKDKDNPARRLFLPLKNNLAAEVAGMAYSLVGVDSSAVVAWEPEPMDVSPDDALAIERDDGGRAEQQDAAADWLRDALVNGPQPAKKLTEKAREMEGIAKRTLDRARKAIGVVAYRPENPGPWWWKMPGEQDAKLSQEELTWHPGIVPLNAANNDHFQPEVEQDAKLPEPGNATIPGWSKIALIPRRKSN